MLLEALDQANKRLRPAEGWLIFWLLAAAVGLLVTAVREVRWVPEDGVVSPAATLGFLLAIMLAKRQLHTLWAWVLMIAYGLLLTTIILAQLLPPLSLLRQGWEPTRQFWLQHGGVFIDRAGGWALAVLSGGSSRETIVFAGALGLSAFFLAAVAGWFTFRWQRPLPGLMLMGLALAGNGYYGAAQIWSTGLFVGVAALLTAVVNYARLETEWTASRVDYPEDVRLELAAYAASIAALLLAFALTLPAFSVTRLQAWFANLAPVAEAESTWNQAFAGVDIPRQHLASQNPGGVGGRGALPRHYLLGNAPELYETVVMTAVVSLKIEDQEVAAPAQLLQGTHWRALSYDVYTGQGWAISEERLDPTGAFQIIPVPVTAGQTTLSQFVFWQQDDRVIRYTTGLPIRFDQETIVSWRGLNDLARVRGEGNVYKATSRLTTATPDELRQTAVTDVPPALLMRYTALPDDVPARVAALAQEVAGGYAHSYDQARALEQFLRQYPYSLDVPLPPAGHDPVDHFLFDLQTGYCDYYASSMVVMARTLGIPARLVIGYNAQPPDENGVQRIRQIDGHSWVEVYFAGYGWVEFEPTATFPSLRDATAVTLDPESLTATFDPPFQESYTPPPIPEPTPSRSFPWQRLLLLAFSGGGVFFLWWRQRQERALRQDEVVWAYTRLQQQARKWGHPPSDSQTPQEFCDDFLWQLSMTSQSNRWQQIIAQARSPVHQIIDLYNRRRYSQQPGGGQEAARRAWARLPRPLRQRWLGRLISRKP